MKVLKTVLSVVFLIAILFVFSFEIKESADNEPLIPALPASLSKLFRDADLIAVATCLLNTLSADDDIPTGFRIDRTVYGRASSGEVIKVDASADAGRKYLLYLKKSDPSDTVYSVLTQDPIPFTDNAATYESVSFPIESILKDIERQEKILTIPSKFYYYDDFHALITSCDEVILGRVISVSKPTATLCRSEAKGETTQSSMNMVFVRIKVENSFSDSFEYGDFIKMVLAPYNSIPIINDTDLTPITSSSPYFNVPSVGNTYVFFLIKGEDKKRDDYFTVNPYEGYVLILKNEIIRPYYNYALKNISDLDTLSMMMKQDSE